MTLAQQAGVVLRALEIGNLPPSRVTCWADRALINEEHPPDWLVTMSLLEPTKGFPQMLEILQHHAERMDSAELDLAVNSYLFLSGRLSIEEAVKLAGNACMSDYPGPSPSAFDPLADMLCDWDQSDFPDLRQADWQKRFSDGLAACGQACGAFLPLIKELYG